MSDDVRIDASELVEAGKRLRQVGDKDLRRAMLRGIRKGAEPAKAAAKTGAATRLPQRGGLAARVARSRFSVSVRTSGRAAGVTIKGSNGYDIASMNRGRLRHRVFGGKRWVNQTVQAGWFSDSIERTAPVVRQAVLSEVRTVQRKLNN